MNGLLEYALRVTGPENDDRRAPDLTWEDEVARFYELLTELDAGLSSRTPETKVLERLLQGPLADALTHAGQLTLLRRLAGAPVARENFIKADIRAGRVGAETP